MFFGERSKEKNVEGIIVPNGEEKLHWDRISQLSMKEALIEKEEKADFIYFCSHWFNSSHTSQDREEYVLIVGGIKEKILRQACKQYQDDCSLIGFWIRSGEGWRREFKKGK